ncbi:MAG TPA: hypothetical protein VHX36_06680 [Candidatus Acidoferrales bacterium]|jgi:hypothetical protein|nr:hypothetical protein [Candidatus Acidoferrales bacterium]
MSIETFSPLSLNVFGTWVTLLDPSDVPAGMSPNLADVDFFPGGVRTRPGLVAAYSALTGAPQINGVKTYITTNLVQRMLVLDSLGNLYEELTPGTLSLIAAGAAKSSLYLSSTTHFGREYIAFGDGVIGQDLPRQYDDSNYDRVSQLGPGEGSAVNDSAVAGNVSPGIHQVAVVFVTRQGYWTTPSPSVSWTAAGNWKASLTNIPTGPSNVVQRLLAFTASGGANFYNVPVTMTINDNTTTSLTVDFTDTILLSGTSMDYLFSQIELPEQLGVVAYSERLFWWGERAQMDNWLNLTFDGGWDASGNGRPLGWQLDSVLGPGASREPSDAIWRDAYRITADGTSITRGYISQGAITDSAGNPLIVPNTDFSLRARVKRSANLSVGTLRVNLFSPTAGQVGLGLSVTAAQATTGYQEFIAELCPPQGSLPSDLALRVYADGVPAPAGESFLIDNIEIFPTDVAQNPSLVRCSGTEEPEAYDGVTGVMSIAENNGQGIRAAFTIRNNLYFVKERSMYVTSDDGVNEPALWQVEEVSNQVGTPSAHGVGIGEEWVVIAGRSGLYLFDGSEPTKISQEIQPTWDSINWAYGHLIWVQVDTQHKRILIGVPMGAATQPNQVLMLDYTEGFGDPLVAMLTAPERSRKWAPWNIPANSCGLIERPSGIAQIFLGSNNSSGKIYALTPGTYSDDGAAINSYYSTAFLAATGLSGRNLFGYLTAYVQGSGVLALSALTPGDASTITIGSWMLTTPASRDLEQFINLLAERVSYQFGTNAAGSWFSLTKLVPWAKPDPFAIVRGGN